MLKKQTTMKEPASPSGKSATASSPNASPTDNRVVPGLVIEREFILSLRRYLGTQAIPNSGASLARSLLYHTRVQKIPRCVTVCVLCERGGGGCKNKKENQHRARHSFL